MKKTAIESRELMQMSVLLALVSLAAIVTENSRSLFMVVLTAFVMLLAFVARYRHRRATRTATRRRLIRRKIRT